MEEEVEEEADKEEEADMREEAEGEEEGEERKGRTRGCLVFTDGCQLWSNGGILDDWG